ncbi:hypothetical protein [Acidobacterium sp. S8]|uniref:hypothetical protein n=1 Tax=Acidobacterium sp. S8 TaxID=1641854 RepID=UPI00131E970B|nr:hypothetical protein [Acidobacterium sp. S8]
MAILDHCFDAISSLIETGATLRETCGNVLETKASKEAMAAHKDRRNQPGVFAKPLSSLLFLHQRWFPGFGD